MSDWEGTRRVETDYAGNPQQICTNAPFGDSATNCATPTGQFFTGQEQDTETGDDHFPARYYIPTVGLWATPDPSDGSYDIENPQSFNRYAYVNGSPLVTVDPSGLAGAGVLSGIGGNLCLGYKKDGINPCSPVASEIAKGVADGLDKLFPSLGATASNVVPFVGFAVTFGCGFIPKTDATSTFCGQSGWTALISKKHPDLATGINDGIALGGLVDGLALASKSIKLLSCFTPANIANPLCDVAIALVVYTVLNDVFSIVWDYLSGRAQFHGSMLPRPGVPGLQGNSSFGVPVQNLKIPGLSGSSSQHNAQSFGFQMSN